ncbi:ATP-binding protein [Candidatus Poribacteria bacterium]
MTGIEIHRLADSKIIETWSSRDLLGLLRQLDVIPDVVGPVSATEIDELILGFLFIFIGLFSVSILIGRRQREAYHLLSFGVFAICVGVFEVSGYLFFYPIFGFDIPRRLIYFTSFMGIHLFPVGLYSFLEQTIGAGYKSIIRRLWQMHLVYSVIVLILLIVNVYPLRLGIIVFAILATPGLIFAMIKCARDAIRGSSEARILSAGFIVLCLFAIHDVFWVLELAPTSRGFFHWGVFCFILALSYILERRFIEAHQQLEEYSHNLEQRVEERTRELAESLQQLKETQDQLIVKEKMAALGGLVAGVAHEVNNPIGAVNSSTDILARCVNRIKTLIETSRSIEDLRNDERLQRSMEALNANNKTIATASDRIARIAESLKNFARLDEAELQNADIHEGIDSALTLIDHEFGDKVSVIKEYGDIPSILCYPGELNQAFMHLLRNAGQSIEDKGTIRIATSVDEGHIKISISDTGKGIPPENLSRIFDPGFTTQGGGIGIGTGLSMVYNIVHKHQGDIRVNSKVGEGTEFIISLPITETPF